MDTYWVTVTLVIAAALVVVLATARPGERTSRPARRWVAIGSSQTRRTGLPSWVGAIERRPGVEAIDLTAPGASLETTLASQLGPALSAGPAVVVVWVGPADLVQGRALPAFLQDLTSLLERCRGRGVRVVVVGMPAFRVGLSGRRGAVRDPLLRLLPEWADAIADAATMSGATVVRLAGAGAPVWSASVEGQTLWFDGADTGPVARRLGAAVDRALAGASGASETVRDEPADPVARRRLGLPPVR